MFLVFARLYCLYPSNLVLNCIKVLIDHDDSSDGGFDDDDEYICKPWTLEPLLLATWNSASNIYMFPELRDVRDISNSQAGLEEIWQSDQMPSPQ